MMEKIISFCRGHHKQGSSKAVFPAKGFHAEVGLPVHGKYLQVSFISKDNRFIT